MGKGNKTREDDPTRRQDTTVILGEYCLPAVLDYCAYDPDRTPGEFAKKIQRIHRALDQLHKRVESAVAKRVPGGRVRIGCSKFRPTVIIYQERLETPEERDERLRDSKRVAEKDIKEAKSMYRSRLRHLQKQNPKALREVIKEFVED